MVKKDPVGEVVGRQLNHARVSLSLLGRDYDARTFWLVLRHMALVKAGIQAYSSDESAGSEHMRST